MTKAKRTDSRHFAQLLLCCLAFAGAAQAQSDAQHTLEAAFYSFDENHDGKISNDEITRYADSSFREMDRAKKGVITAEAFRDFSVGLADVAAQYGVSDRYERAKAKIFKRWSGGKSTMTLEKYKAGVLADAAAAGGGADGLDMQGFLRAPFIRQLMKSLH